MLMRIVIVTMVVAAWPIGALAQSDTAPEQGTKPVLTKGQAAEWFYLDVARCLYALEHNVSITELPPQVKADLRPALPSERFLFKDPAVKVWTTDLYGSHVVLAERTADRCEIVADQISVERTFGQVRGRLRQADPALAEYPVKPGYKPLAYQLERTANGSRYIVHLEGSEPGGLANPAQMLRGHASPYSLLTAVIVRQVETEKPLFR